MNAPEVDRFRSTTASESHKAFDQVAVHVTKCTKYYPFRMSGLRPTYPVSYPRYTMSSQSPKARFACNIPCRIRESTSGTQPVTVAELYCTDGVLFVHPPQGSSFMRVDPLEACSRERLRGANTGTATARCTVIGRNTSLPEHCEVGPVEVSNSGGGARPARDLIVWLEVV